MINWCVLFEKPTNNSAATTIHLFIHRQTSIAKVLHFYTAPRKLTTFGTPKVMKVWKMNLFFVSGWFSGEPSEFFNSGYLQPGPVLGVCFSEPLGPGYGTSTVPWKIYQSVGFHPNKNHRNPPISTRNWGCGNTRVLIIQDIRDIHWSLVFVKIGMRVNSPFNKNCGQMKGAMKARFRYKQRCWDFHGLGEKKPT